MRFKFAKHEFIKTRYNRLHVLLYLFAHLFLVVALGSAILGSILIVNSYIVQAPGNFSTVLPLTLGILGIYLTKYFYTFGRTNWFFNDIDQVANATTTLGYDFNQSDYTNPITALNTKRSILELLTLIENVNTAPFERQKARTQLSSLLNHPSLTNDVELKKGILNRHPYLA